MSESRPIRCSECGAILPRDGSYCERCGAPVGKGYSGGQDQREYAPDSGSTVTVDLEDLSDITGDGVLPDVATPPRLGRALSRGWSLVADDTGGTFIAGLLFFFITLAVSCIPIISYLLIIALYVGIMGWANERRRGMSSNISTIFNIATDRFKDAFLLGLVLMVVNFICMLPLIIAYISFITWMFSSAISASVTGELPLMEFLAGSSGLFAFLILWLFIFGFFLGPLIQSFKMLSCWAIAQGYPFNESTSWAWSRIKKQFFGWWLSGLVIGYLSGIGIWLCFIGVFISWPWGWITWAEIAGDRGERVDR